MKNTISIKNIALRTIEIETDAIHALIPSIDDSFEQAVKTMHESKGRLVVTGIGKSAIIGKKYVSTFNSTGSPAIFLHAADAVHGDIGMMHSDDILICISKSGETPEIKVLIPLVKQFGNKIISVVSNQDSYLAKHSDFVIHTPISIEADPNNLAPTASTTSQLVIGDAMATCLLALKGFNQRDFALLHPGGTLGKQLYLTVGDLISRHEKPMASPDQSISEIIVEMTSKRLGAATVLYEGLVVGIVTDGDLRRMLNNHLDWNHLTGKDIMSRDPKKVSPECLAVEALSIMRKHSISQLIVVDQGNYVGMIHLHDIIKEGII